MKDTKDTAVEKVKQKPSEPVREGRVYVPNTDIYEKDNAILVRCDMPGVAQDQLDIQLENNELAITGHQAAVAPEGMDRLMEEYESGTYRRKFNIPQLIDREKIRARLHNGVLELELPKAEQAKPRKIEIATGG
ncbi:Hsp20/alpha crystallin family protein [Pontiellaceae bacterium B12227]|nr:Hsp20/alpha crystallin family protein [Pontiellaceae bacterium B12227]